MEIIIAHIHLPGKLIVSGAISTFESPEGLIYQFYSSSTQLKMSLNITDQGSVKLLSTEKMPEKLTALIEDLVQEIGKRILGH